MVRQIHIGNICNNGGISNSSTGIVLKTSGGGKINIINTYAPHMGYRLGESAMYWGGGGGGRDKRYRETNKDTGCVIRCTDNNTHIGQTGEIKYWAMGI